MRHKKETKLQKILKQIQLRAQVRYGKDLTQDEMASLAGVTARSFGDWMRGVTAPGGMTAVFELLSKLSEADVQEILQEWKKDDVQQELPGLNQNRSIRTFDEEQRERN
ncbi:hypothetical protein [Herbaspirillum seropedicae]|uniref:hypothetical protein n=1 Tax=Herbaspirillum seropedicae TaxID=964 RepID=UPI00086396DA|nr:hypothetical protein [Herbaspirillum seropedicae]AON52321.1 Acyl transferase domain protein [Herbaspirillum seropedicae]